MTMTIVEDIQLSKLIPNEDNPKIHTEDQINKIKSSIKKFGFKVPILIDEDNNIVAGHGRYLAAKKLDYKKIPCIKLEGLSDEELKTFMIADNKVAESGWDPEKLLKLFDGINDENLMKITGFSEENLKNLDLNYSDLDNDLKELELEELSVINWTAQFRNEKDFELVKEVMIDLKKKNKMSNFTSDYSNGVLLKLLCEDEKENAKVLKKLAKNYKKRKKA